MPSSGSERIKEAPKTRPVALVPAIRAWSKVWAMRCGVVVCKTETAAMMWSNEPSAGPRQLKEQPKPLCARGQWDDSPPYLVRAVEERGDLGWHEREND